MINGSMKNLTKGKIRELGYVIHSDGYITHIGTIIKTYGITKGDAVFASIVDYGQNIVWGVELARMVAWHHIGPIEDSDEIIHLDGNVNNCAAENLEIRSDLGGCILSLRLDTGDTINESNCLGQTIAKYKKELASRREWTWWPEKPAQVTKFGVFSKFFPSR